MESEGGHICLCEFVGLVLDSRLCRRRISCTVRGWHSSTREGGALIEGE